MLTIKKSHAHLAIAFLFIVFASCGSSETKGTYKTLSDADLKLVDAIKNEMAKTNAKCPIIQGGYQTDSISNSSNFLYTFNVKALNYNSREVNLETAKAALKAELCDAYLNGEVTKPMRDIGVKVAYDVKDKNGEFLAYFICE